LAEKQITDAVDALAKRDSERANRVIAADVQIDALQREIEEKAVLTIARRQPMAVDLREIVSALRVANDLERVGDLAKNIGKREGGGAAWGRHVAGSDKGGVRRFARSRCGQGGRRWEGRGRGRCDAPLAVPRVTHLKDGAPPPHHVLHPPDVLRQEYRTHGRS